MPTDKVITLVTNDNIIYDISNIDINYYPIPIGIYDKDINDYVKHEVYGCFYSTHDLSQLNHPSTITYDKYTILGVSIEGGEFNELNGLNMYGYTAIKVLKED